MVLPGYALMNQGTQVHVGAWPGGADTRQIFLSQAFASQAACYVICAAGIERPDDLPEAYRDNMVGWNGQSCIIDPWGNIIAGPVDGETIVTAKGSLETVRTAKAVCDVAGHYSRPDVFSLHVNRQPRQHVVSELDSGRQAVDGHRAHYGREAVIGANGDAGLVAVEERGVRPSLSDKRI